MKNALFFSIAVFLFSSCSYKVLQPVVTHKQVMDGFNTKDKIIAKFGLPISKKSEGEYEDWLYDYGTKTVTDAAAVGSSYGGTRSVGAASSGAVAGRNAYGNPYIAGGGVAATNSNSAATASAKSRTVTQDIRTYVKFTLKGNSVVTWETNNVDYGKYEYVKKKLSEL
jgi:hypothetical protein